MTAGNRHPHAGSGLLAAGAGIGLAFAILCIVMYQTKAVSGPPWHALAIVFGVSSALAMSFVALRRGWENARDD